MQIRPYLAATSIAALLATGYIAGRVYPRPPAPPAWAADQSSFEQAIAAYESAHPAPPAPVDQPALQKAVDAYLSSHPLPIDRQIDDYVRQHSGQIMEQAQADQDRRDRLRVQQIIASRHAEIFDDPAAVSLGDPQGDVTLVEFFDYRCPFCKADAPVVDKLIAADPHLRVVLRELPVLGPDSEYLAHLALAAGKQGRYHEFYNAVFAHMPAHAERKAVDQALQAAGFDPRKLAALSQAPEIEAVIRQDLDLAKAIGIDGTPTWLVGNFIVPLDGTHPLEQQLAGYIDLVRKTARSRPPSATP